MSWLTIGDLVREILSLKSSAICAFLSNVSLKFLTASNCLVCAPSALVFALAPAVPLTIALTSPPLLASHS